MVTFLVVLLMVYTFLNLLGLLVFNHVTCDDYAAFFNCTTVGWASDSMMAIRFSWLGPELLVCCLAQRGPTGVFLLLRN